MIEVIRRDVSVRVRLLERGFECRGLMQQLGKQNCDSCKSLAAHQSEKGVPKAISFYDGKRRKLGRKTASFPTTIPVERNRSKVFAETHAARTICE